MDLSVFLRRGMNDNSHVVFSMSSPMYPLDQLNQAPDDQSELTMSVLMTPDMANFSGNVHGGAILKLLD